MKTFMKIRYFRLWLVFALAITVSAGLVYLVSQQIIRQSANDPQIQIAEDVAVGLSGGANPKQLDTQNRTDIAKSLAAYVIVYDNKGQPLASTAQLDGAVPIVPFGALQTAQNKGENRVTWQPKTGVRSALVIVPFNSGSISGFVVAGRSLRESEAMDSNILMIAGLFWLATLMLTFVIIFSISKLDFSKIRFRKRREITK